MNPPPAVLALGGLMLGLALILFGVIAIVARRRWEERRPDRRRRDGDAGWTSDGGSRPEPGDGRSKDADSVGDGGGSDGGGGDGGGGGGGGD